MGQLGGNYPMNVIRHPIRNALLLQLFGVS